MSAAQPDLGTHIRTAVPATGELSMKGPRAIGRVYYLAAQPVRRNSYRLPGESRGRRELLRAWFGRRRAVCPAEVLPYIKVYVKSCRRENASPRVYELWSVVYILTSPFVNCGSLRLLGGTEGCKSSLEDYSEGARRGKASRMAVEA